MQLSSLIGKPILTRAGDALGYVIAARPTRDLKKLACLVCADGDENDFILPARAVLSAPETADAVIAGGARLNAPTGIPSPIGKRAYSHTGEALGTISDILLGEAPALVLSSAEAPIMADRAVIGETVIVYPSAEQRRRAPSARGSARTGQTGGKSAQKRPKTAQMQQREGESAPPPISAVGRAEADFPDTMSAAPLPQTPPKRSEPAPPQHFRIDRTNLLGRRLKKSVYDETGAPIARAGERITPEIVTRARRKNRLLALTVNTLTNIDV